jgi:hypothetical protein
VGRDHLLHGNEALAVRHHDESRQERWNLDSRDPLLTAPRRANDHGQVQREIADIGKGVRRVDRQRGEHREDALLEHAVDVLAIPAVERSVVGEPKADFAKALDDGLERAHLTRREVDRATLDLGQLLLHRHAVRAQRGHTGSALFDQAADANLEELVEVAARDGEELRALEEHARRVLGELEDARVEIEPAEVPIDVSMPVAERCRVLPAPGRVARRCVFGHLGGLGDRHQPSSSIAPESRKTRSSAMLVTRSAMRSRWCAMNTRLVALKTVVLSSVIIWMRSSNSRW